MYYFGLVVIHILVVVLVVLIGYVAKMIVEYIGSDYDKEDREDRVDTNNN